VVVETMMTASSLE